LRSPSTVEFDNLSHRCTATDIELRHSFNENDFIQRHMSQVNRKRMVAGADWTGTVVDNLCVVARLSFVRKDDIAYGSNCSFNDQ